VTPIKKVRRKSVRRPVAVPVAVPVTAPREDDTIVEESSSIVVLETPFNVE
jgi:hypothetical protein